MKSADRFTLTVILFFLLTLIANSQTRSRWHAADEKPIEELSITQFLYNNNSKFFYRISNDNNNLYIQIKTNEAQVAEHIMRSGISVWFDEKANGKKRKGIKYPVMQGPPAMPQNRNKQQYDPDLKEAQKPDLRFNETAQMEITGFSEKQKSKIIAANNKYGIHAKLSANGSFTNLSFTVPFSAIGINKAEQDKLSILITADAGNFTGQASKGEGAPGQGRPGKQGGPPSGGGPRGGQGGGGNGKGPQGPHPQMQTNNNIQIKLKKVELAPHE